MRSMRRRHALLATTAVIGLPGAVGCGTGDTESPALFDIADNFALRHQDLRQQRDYAPAFLDWIFWWYLATVEPSDQLLARPVS